MARSRRARTCAPHRDRPALRAERGRRGQQVRVRHAEELELVERLALEHGAYAPRSTRASRRAEKGATRCRGRRRRRGRADRLPLRLRVRGAHRGEAPRDRRTRVRRRRRLPAQDRAATEAAQFEARVWASCRSAWRRRTSRSRTTRRSATRRPGFTVTVRDLRPYTGRAGSSPSAATCRRCRASGRPPAAFAIDVAADGSTVGLF
jgi:hypothetical protein